MQQIEVDFDVWKALTLRRDSEAHSYNDVLRSLLGLTVADATDAGISPAGTGGRTLGNRFVPNGSKLRAKYKGAWAHAEIVDGKLVADTGKIFNSASAAARAVTGTNVNGLLFWDVKRPGDTGWTTLASLRRIS